MESKFLFFTIFLFLLCIPNSIFGDENQPSEQEKLKKEIELLKQQINEKDESFSSNFFIEVLAIIGIVSGASVTGFWAWIKEKNTPPAAEQEKILNDIVRVWHSQSHIEAFDNVWNDIENNKSTKNMLDHHWNILSVKKFPIDTYVSEKRQEEIKSSMKLYLRQRLKIKKDSILDEKIKSIQNSSAINYYDHVFKNLPNLIEIAIDASLFEKSKKPTNVEDDSFKNLKRLMIFTRTREDKEVVKILHKAILFKKLNPSKSDSFQKSEGFIIDENI